jgi:hypothetical protein
MRKRRRMIVKKITHIYQTVCFTTFKNKTFGLLLHHGRKKD